MLLRKLERVFMWLACAAVALIAFGFSERSAYAAILPACENHPLTAMPIEWLGAVVLPLDMTVDACVAADSREARDAGAEDGGDLRVPAMCDDRGASVVAPQRVLPVVDARIDAPPSCGSEIAGPSCAPAPNDSPLASPAFAIAEQGSLGNGLSIPPASSELAPPFVIVEGAPLRGVTRDIDHPPR